MARKRTQAARRSEAAYEAARLEEGRTIQFSIKLKTDADRALLERLQARFPGLSRQALVRKALERLDTA